MTWSHGAKLVCCIGDVCPEDHGGGQVRDHGEQGLWLWYTHGAEIDGDQTLTVYRVPLDDPDTWLDWVDWDGALRCVGMGADELAALRARDERAWAIACYEIAAAYHGWGELDPYPQSVPYLEVARWTE